MRLRRRLIWIPLALAGAIVAASAPSWAQGYYEYYGPAPYYYDHPGFGDGPGSCYEDSLRGRVCRD
jgi:hypothetical protein